ncbi:hypothetical protein H5407_17870 [Mitsuaria sp. WAJ17]|uniref:hypothetical protein n=1 Tax=Mitsuaria sp. WAJ17 TaxID=2761452 RepID=UPI0016041027|nr:hypothetical protein [Mitsuaria sp. WAJ17]MBB2487102.1 hypothetical protein [Mitsuaria sp. WAJ17]
MLAFFAAAANAQNTPSPAPGRDLQALSCTNTIPTATPKDPRQPLINCTGDFFTPLDAVLMNFNISKLERVTVTGRSNSQWRTLCIGQACAALFGDEAVATRINDAMGGWAEEAMAILRKQTLKMSACTKGAIVPKDARTVTSKDDADARTRAAGQIIVAYMNGGNILSGGRVEVLITFSDNGTQTFKYNTWDPAVPIPKDDLKTGDGKSKCP